MEVLDTTTEFFEQWKSHNPFTIEHLEVYYAKYPDLFDTYFTSHCKRTPERLGAAIERYPQRLDAMRRTASLLPSIVEEVYQRMSAMLDFPLPLQVRMLVGGFGSNAYVTHDGVLHFAVETMIDHPDGLRVLVAHEMAHAFHFAMLKAEGFQMSQLAWDGYTSLYLEGVATLTSEVVNPGFPDEMYFTFGENPGDAWISFCKEHLSDIKERLNADLLTWTMDEEVEWFRLKGGKNYGYDRLGYFIGTEFIKACVQAIGLKDTITLWARHEIKPVVQEWMDDGKISFLTGH